MKISDIVSETSAGGIAGVAMPLGNPIKRTNPSVFPDGRKKKKTKNKKVTKEQDASIKE
jgi:hypothetical protein